MASISNRQLLATQKAEAASQIIHDFANRDSNSSIDTESGQIPSLKKWLNEREGIIEDLIADAALTSGKIYDDISSGLASTVDGQYFSVPSVEDTESFIFYRNTNGAAHEVTRYPSHGKVETLEQQVAELLYVPPTIESLLIDGAISKTVEVGSSVANVFLSWVLSGSEPESQSLDQGIGSVPVGTASKVVNGPFNSGMAWALTVGDTSPAGNSRSDSAQVSLDFRQKRYWGVSPDALLDNADILALSSEFATAKGKSVTYDATGGRYLYYCYPASWGALSGVTVGGLAFSDYSEAIQSFTNSSGHAEDYRVVRFNGLQTGSNIQVVWS